MTLFSGNNQQQQVGEQWLMVVVVLGVGWTSSTSIVEVFAQENRLSTITGDV